MIATPEYPSRWLMTTAVLAVTMMFGARASRAVVPPTPATRPLTSVPAPYVPEPRHPSDAPRRSDPIAARAYGSLVYAAVVDDADLYWTQADLTGPTQSYTPYATLWHAPKSGAPEQIAVSAGYSLALDRDHLYYTDAARSTIRVVDRRDRTDRILARSATEPVVVVAGGAYVYWASSDGIRRVAKDGGAVLTWRGGESSIAADDEFFYYYTSAGEVFAIRHGEDGPPRRLATGLSDPSDLAVVGETLYMTAGDRLFGVPRTGGSLRWIATGGRASSLAVSQGDLYWTSWDDDRAKATATSDCESFNLGAVRRVHGTTIETIAVGCSVRNVAASDSTIFVVNDGQLTRVRRDREAEEGQIYR